MRRDLGTLAVLAAPFNPAWSIYMASELREESFLRGAFTAAVEHPINLRINHSGPVLATSHDADRAFRVWQTEAGLFAAVFLNRMPVRETAGHLAEMSACGDFNGASVTMLRDTIAGQWGEHQGTQRFLITHVGRIKEIALTTGDRRPAYEQTWVEHLSRGEAAAFLRTGDVQHSKALARTRQAARDGFDRHTGGSFPYWLARVADARGRTSPNLLQETC